MGSQCSGIEPPDVASMAMGDLRFAAVDLETSGLSVKRHRVLQIGVVVVDASGEVVDRWTSLVRPRVRWLHRIGPRHIHGIGRASVAKAPPARLALEEMARRTHGCILVAHNVAFDVAFLRRAFARAGIPFASAQALCTLELSRRLDPQRTLSHRLTDVCARHGVCLDRPHDALADAQATAALIPHLLRANGVDSPGALAALLSRSEPALL